MSKLETLEKIVLEALEEVPEARKDDFILLLEVCERKKAPIAGVTFAGAMKYHKQCGIPNWKSVERCRRKIQAQRPDLKDPETAERRAEAEETFVEYSHS